MQVSCGDRIFTWRARDEKNVVRPTKPGKRLSNNLNVSNTDIFIKRTGTLF